MCIYIYIYAYTYTCHGQVGIYTVSMIYICSIETFCLPKNEIITNHIVGCDLAAGGWYAYMILSYICILMFVYNMYICI